MRPCFGSLGLALAILITGSAWAAEPPSADKANAPPAEPAEVAKTRRAECAALADAADKANTLTVVGHDGWLFLASELRHLGAGKFWGDDAARVSRAAKPDWADPLPAILDFKAQLDKAGIELLLVPVPPKAAIYPDMLPASAAQGQHVLSERLDAADAEFYKVLADAGVKVVDLVPEFLADRFPKDGPLYCKQDSHWSGVGCAAAAKRIAQEVQGRPWLKNAAAPAFTLESQGRSVEITGDLARVLPPDRLLKEEVALQFVGKKTDAGLEPLEDDPAGPVILLGDSHTLVFHAGADLFAKGAGLADHLALRLMGRAVDVVGVRGSGATPARMNLYQRSLSNPSYLAGKRLVIWCFAAREFTESQGWRKLPLTKESAAAAGRITSPSAATGGSRKLPRPGELSDASPEPRKRKIRTYSNSEEPNPRRKSGVGRSLAAYGNGGVVNSNLNSKRLTQVVTPGESSDQVLWPLPNRPLTARFHQVGLTPCFFQSRLARGGHPAESPL